MSRKRTSLKSRRQISSVKMVSRTTTRSGRYLKQEFLKTGDRNVFADAPGAENVTRIETEEQFTIHAASEGLTVSMTGCNGAKLRKRRFTLSANCPGYSMTDEAGKAITEENPGTGRIILHGIPDDFIRPWIKRERKLIASKQTSNSSHLERIARIRPEYKTSELDDEQTRKLYGDHRPRRLNRGSKNGSRERCIDELPTANEIDRCEAESDGIREYEMPTGGHLETARKLASLPDHHQEHVDSL